MAVLDPHALWWLFNRKGWDDRLPAAAKRFVCIPCRQNQQKQAKGAARITLVREAPTVTSLPLPPEHEWKKAINRFRGICYWNKSSYAAAAVNIIERKRSIMST